MLFLSDIICGKINSMSDPLELLPDETWGPQDERWKEFYSKRVYNDGPIPSRSNTAPLPDSFGRNLDTLEKARLWLTNPHNWHSSKLFILKWDGMNVTISETHGMRLIREHWDNGLPWSVKMTQARKKRGESMEEVSSHSGEAPTDG